ncbi:hypothetical protein [Maribacter cobaltidurans]|uniref:Uncharacterized protein n=1 Tax=Maribacter cobaltidurans TaxID=1178778 RepID=A0A223V0A9_9FLAO|nr:hypothetical protein [Maribacter cobaltidurans]ASV28855.1 hypothetical protein CJ263_00635 [Maribacter cobaltidurans]GGD74259.1 hypothetical protein GCM10011412_09890 [Maribacter cobaltidurans]
MSRTFFPFFVLLVSLSGCKSHESAQNGKDGNKGMELILSGDYSGIEDEQLLVINNKVQWEEFFGRVNRTRKPGLTVPEIDFEKNTIIIRLKGETTNNQPDVVWGNVSNETLFLKRTKNSAKNESSALITPFFIYSIPKTNKSIKIQ